MRLKRLLAMGLAAPLSVASALFVGMATPSAAIGVNPVTIDCGDNAPVYAHIDALALTKLVGAVQASLDNPSGSHACQLGQEESGKQDARAFVFGAGTYGSFAGCIFNFKIKAHLDEEGAHGFQTSWSPDNNPAICGGAGRLEANVTCLVVSGNRAEIRGIIEEATGPQFDFIPPPREGKVWVSDVTDSPPGQPDTIAQGYDFAGTEHACAIGSLGPPEYPLDRGHIEVEG